MPNEMPTMDGLDNDIETTEGELSLEEVLADKLKDLSEIKPAMLANNPTLQARKAQLDMEVSLLRSFPNDAAYQEFMNKVNQRDEE